MEVQRPAIQDEEPHGLVISVDACSEAEPLAAALQELSEALAPAADMRRRFGAAALVDRKAESTILLTGLADFRDLAMRLGDDIAVRAVRAGELSQIEAARLLHVHQATIARWVKAAIKAEAEPDA